MQADRNLAVPDSFMLASFMVESSSRRRQVRINNFVTLTRSWGLPLEVLGNRSASFHGWDHLQRVYLNHSSTRPRERELVAYADSADAFVQGTTADWVSAFHRVAKGKPVVVGLESNCPPGRWLRTGGGHGPHAHVAGYGLRWLLGTRREEIAISTLTRAEITRIFFRC